MIKYLAQCDRINSLNVERETNKYVYVKGRRMAKITSWDSVHDTWEAAQAHLIAEATKDMNQALGWVESAKKKIEKINNLSKPNIVID